MDKLIINEIYTSVQGEGPFTGTPCVFIRLSECNLNCSWCDSYFTHRWSHKKFDFPHVLGDKAITDRSKEAHSMTIEQIINKITELIKDTPINHFVFTGGEPLVQQKVLPKLLNEIACLDQDRFDNRDKLINPLMFEIETNGTIMPNEELLDFDIHYNVSFKTSNSGNSLKMRYKPKVLEFFANDQDAIFKPVVSNEKDLEEINEIIEKTQIDAYKVYLMPEGTTSKELQAKSPWIIEQCLKYGYNFCQRVQVTVYENKRAV